jgi:hypothetical protein
MKKQVDWYRRNDESWAWHVWQWETGDDLNTYVFRSPGHTLKDLDDRSERTARARSHFNEAVLPHLASISASIAAILMDVSHWPEDYGEVPMVTVYDYKVRYGMAAEFEDVIKRIHKAIQESGWPIAYAWSRTVSGGEVPAYALIIPHKSFADMKGPEQPFWDMMHEALGHREAESVRTSLNACVKEMHSRLSRFRPDLSYMP